MIFAICHQPTSYTCSCMAEQWTTSADVRWLITSKISLSAHIDLLISRHLWEGACDGCGAPGEVGGRQIFILTARYLLWRRQSTCFFCSLGTLCFREVSCFKCFALLHRSAITLSLFLFCFFCLCCLSYSINMVMMMMMMMIGRYMVTQKVSFMTNDS